MAKPSNVDAPHAAGPPTVGEAILVTVGNWNNSPTSYAYDWRKDGASLGISWASYLLSSSDVGGMIDCKVTAANLDGYGEAVSNAVGPIAQRPPGSPDGRTIADEQRAKSEVIEDMGVAAYHDAVDERPDE
jgi:hypothetical protein